jgi:hypothetical protein
MSRGHAPKYSSKHSFGNQVRNAAGQLTAYREALNGIRGDDPDFDSLLGGAIQAAAEIVGKSTRMDRGSYSRRTACARILASQAMRVVGPDYVTRQIEPVDTLDQYDTTFDTPPTEELELT